jgi:hypothetical protein
MTRIIDRMHALIAFVLLLASIVAVLPAQAAGWTAEERPGSDVAGAGQRDA